MMMCAHKTRFQLNIPNHLFCVKVFCAFDARFRLANVVMEPGKNAVDNYMIHSVYGMRMLLKSQGDWAVDAWRFIR